MTNHHQRPGFRLTHVPTGLFVQRETRHHYPNIREHKSAVRQLSSLVAHSGRLSLTERPVRSYILAPEFAARITQGGRTLVSGRDAVMSILDGRLMPMLLESRKVGDVMKNALHEECRRFADAAFRDRSGCGPFSDWLEEQGDIEAAEKARGGRPLEARDLFCCDPKYRFLYTTKIIDWKKNGGRYP